MRLKTSVGEKEERGNRVPARVLFCILAALDLSLSMVVAADMRVTLRLLLTDCWGNRITHGTLVQIIPDHSRLVMYIGYPQKDSVRLPPGSYTIIVQATNYITAARSIDVNTRDVFIPICLDLAPIERPEEDVKHMLMGSVAKSKMSVGPMWVRLVGIYCDYNTTELINDAGEFLFERVRPGRFALMLFDNGTLKANANIDVRVFQTKVSIDEKGVVSAK